MNIGTHVRLIRYPEVVGKIDYLLTHSNKIIYLRGADERICSFATLDREFDLPPCERACVIWEEGSPKVSFVRTDRIEEVPDAV